MAIFEANSRVKAGTRSNTKLFVSGGASPAEQWITDDSLPSLFTYEYGGPGLKDVVISKGMAVAIKQDPQLDYETGKLRGVLTVAGTANSAVVGIAPYNLARHNKDFLDGNQPSIVTREYIELPYIPNASDAANVKWGAVHGAGLKNGDLVTFSRDPQNLGKLIKWVEGTHSIADILGQVLAMEIDQEPWGWLKWALWDEIAADDDIDAGPNSKAGYAAPNGDGYPFDPTYRDGKYPQKDGYLTQYTVDPTGIPGLLDGSQKAQTPQTKVDTVPAGYASQAYTVDLGFKNIVDGSVVVLNGAVTLPASAYTVDLKAGKVTVNSASTGNQITVNFRANFFGTPSGWDYKGAVGAVRILLKR